MTGTFFAVTLTIGLLVVIGLDVAIYPLLLTAWSILTAFLITGYVLQKALGLDQLVNSGPAQLAISVAMSVVTLVLVGISFFVLSWPVQAQNWVLLLGIVTIVAGIIAILRDLNRGFGWRIPPLQLRLDSVMFLAAIALFVTALIFAYQSDMEQQQQNQFTQLWIVGEGEHSRPDMLEVGIANFEQETVSYQLELRTPEVFITDWEDITLPVGGVWTVNVSIDEAWYEQGQVIATLFRDGTADERYREVFLDFNNFNGFNIASE